MIFEVKIVTNKHGTKRNWLGVFLNGWRRKVLTTRIVKVKDQVQTRIIKEGSINSKQENIDKLMERVFKG